MMPRILVFDSGLGGLSVLRVLRRALPHAALSYAADTAAFPYGRLSEQGLIDRVRAVIAALLAAAPFDAVVIACNTASTAALAAVRQDHPHMPFVGVVPAVKPAAAQTASGVIGLLATPATVSSPYTDRLIAEHASHRRVLRHGAPRLAALAEAALRGTMPSRATLAEELAPLFTDRALDTVVLGCTHYPLLAAELAAAAPWPVTWLESGEAIARQTARVLAAPPLAAEPPAAPGQPHSFITGPAPGVAAALTAEGLPPPRILSLPLAPDAEAAACSASMPI